MTDRQRSQVCIGRQVARRPRFFQQRTQQFPMLFLFVDDPELLKALVKQLLEKINSTLSDSSI